MHLHRARLAVEAEEDEAVALFVGLRYVEVFDGDRLSSFQFDQDLFVGLQTIEESRRGQHLHDAKLLPVVVIVFEDLRIQLVGQQIAEAVLVTEFLFEGRPFELEVDRLQVFVRPLGVGFLAFQDEFLELRGEPTFHLPEIAPKQSLDAVREREGVAPGQQFFSREAVRGHEHGQIADHLRRGGHFDQIAEQEVGSPVIVLDLFEAVFQPQRPGLRPQIGVLPSRDLVFIDFGGAGTQFGFEGKIVLAHGLPIIGMTVQAVEVDRPFARVPLQHGHHRVEIGLAGQARHRSDGQVDDVDARLHGFEVGRRLDRRRIVRVQMHRQVDGFLQCRDQQFGCLRLEEAGHVFDRDQMSAGVFQAARQVEVVLQIVLRTRRIGDIAGIAKADFRQSLRPLAHRPNAGLHRLHPVEAVEDAEYVDPRFGRLLDEAYDQIIGIGRIAHGIRAAQQHLKANVGNGLTQLREPLPGIFLQKA